MVTQEVTNSKYAKMVEEVRAIYQKYGAELFHEADEYGINEFYPSKSGDVEFVFYCDSLSKIATPDGYIIPLGSYSNSGNTTELALSELIERFGLELISDFTPTDWRKGERWITYKVTKE